jgi:hypothetical protein
MDAPRPASRLARALPLLLFALCAAAALAPALGSLQLFSARYDWRYFEAMGEISRRAVLYYHEAPLWNPYSCGGEVALANPQSLDAAPSFLLLLLFGTAAGYKLGLLLYTFLAMHGCFCLGRRLGLGIVGATVAALGFGLSGYLALHFSEGHVTFIGIALFPYLLWSFDRALDEIEWIIPTGLFAAWIALLGGTFTPPMAAELLLLWAVMAAIGRRSLRPLGLLAVAGAVALCAGAVRMFPVLEFVRDHPRPPFMRAPDVSWPWQLLTDLVAWREFGPVPGRKYWAHEYAARLPWVLLPLWTGALVLLVARRLPAELRQPGRRLAVLLVCGFLLAMGNFSPIAPWSLLQRLPVLRDLRVPSRHLGLLVLALALLSGIGWQCFVDWWNRRRPQQSQRNRRILCVLGGLLLVATAADGVRYTSIQYRGVFTIPLPVPSGPVPFFQIHTSWQQFRENLIRGVGTIRPAGARHAECDEEAPLQRADELDAGEVPQERLLDPAAGEITASSWSPNRRVVTIELKRPTVLLVNSNWNEHWKSDLGQVTKVAGRLAVDLSQLAPGRHVVTLRYAPRSFFIGAAVSALALPLLVILFVIARRRRAANRPAAP